MANNRILPYTCENPVTHTGTTGFNWEITEFEKPACIGSVATQYHPMKLEFLWVWNLSRGAIFQFGSAVFKWKFTTKILSKYIMIEKLMLKFEIISSQMETDHASKEFSGFRCFIRTTACIENLKIDISTDIPLLLHKSQEWSIEVSINWELWETSCNSYDAFSIRISPWNPRSCRTNTKCFKNYRYPL